MTITKKKIKYGGTRKSKMKFGRFRETYIYKKTFFDETLDKKIAVVGNSQSLFNHSYGSSIDGHDLVIRFNKPATLMFDDVLDTHGSKMNFWCYWTVGAFFKTVIENEEAPQRIKDTFFNDETIRKIQVRVNGHTSLTSSYIDYSLPGRAYSNINIMIKSYTERRPITPSAGAALLGWLKMVKPKSVSIYGMDFKETPTFSEIDRYDEDMEGFFDVRCKHDYAAEKMYVKENILTDKRFKLYA
jgi:hypothetical protein